jgi:hypothetical protein
MKLLNRALKSWKKKTSSARREWRGRTVIEYLYEIYKFDSENAPGDCQGGDIKVTRTTKSASQQGWIDSLLDEVQVSGSLTRV